MADDDLVNRGAVDTDEYKGDPIPSKEERKGDQTKQYVRGISSVAKTQLGDMRDKLDDVVRAIETKEAELIAAVEEHIAATATAIQTGKIISDAMVQVQKCFAPMPKPTITQRNGGGSH